MILTVLIILPLLGGVVAWILGNRAFAAKTVSIITLVADLCVVLYILFAHNFVQDGSNWMVEFQKTWIPRFGISIHFAADGISLLLAALTSIMGVLAVFSSWNEIKVHKGFFYFCLLWNISGVMGVFLSVDLFLFYFFWEMMLVPMYLLISIWGYEDRKYASMKFFIFTQAGGLLIFLSIVGLHIIHGKSTGNYSFDFTVLTGAALSGPAVKFLFAGFILGFFIKIPAFLLHNWLPDAHTQAPSAGSVILAGLLLKTGAYGVLRFVLLLFPETAVDFRIPAMIIGTAGILYGAKLAFAQTDLKRLVAYTSISHMGFVITGIFTMNEIALAGVVLQMICHAFSTGALFMIAGAIKERLHTREMDGMGGLWDKVPRMGGSVMFLVMASLGLPGLGNFAAEFLILAGAWRVSMPVTAVASLGLVASAVYSLRIVQKIFHGPVIFREGDEIHGAENFHKEEKKFLGISDFNPREVFTAGVIIIMLLGIGMFPNILINLTRQPVQRISHILSAEKP